MIKNAGNYYIKCEVCGVDRSPSGTTFTKEEDAVKNFVKGGGVMYRGLCLCWICLDSYRKINRILGDFEFLLKIGGEFKESRTEEVDK